MNRSFNQNLTHPSMSSIQIGSELSIAGLYDLAMRLEYVGSPAASAVADKVAVAFPSLRPRKNSSNLIAGYEDVFNNR